MLIYTIWRSASPQKDFLNGSVGLSRARKYYCSSSSRENSPDSNTVDTARIENVYDYVYTVSNKKQYAEHESLKE